MVGRLHLEQPRLGIGISFDPVITVEMIRGDVEENGDVAVEAVGEIDLVGRKLEHIDPVLGERLLAQDRVADIAGHRRRQPGGPGDVADQSGGRRLAVGAGNSHHLVARERLAGQSEQFDVADDRHAGVARLARDRVAVERYARGHDDSRIAAEVSGQQIADPGLADDGIARLLAIVPGQYLRSAGDERVDGGEPGTGKAQHRIFLPGECGARDHRSFKVESPARARTKLMIQKRMTTVGSDHPICSK